MIVLGVESSCDETGLAVYDTERGLLADVLHSQVDLHALYGGVVPELASRDHVRRLVPLARQVLREAGVSGSVRTIGGEQDGRRDATTARISDERSAPPAPAEGSAGTRSLGGVAYTAGPGLAGALMTGALAARALAWALDVPALGVHHMEGHLLSPMLEPEAPPFPFVCLLVSGGHTQLVRVDGVGRYRLLGQSIDDAAGEAFDKTAKMLGLPYPGGAALARLAEAGDETALSMPRPMLGRPGLDFSFSGLKTAAVTRLRAFESARGERSDDGEGFPAGIGPAGDALSGGPPRERFAADLAAGFEAAVVDVLTEKCRRALAQENIDTLVVAGGVSANRRLRTALETVSAERGGRTYCPRLAFCTDNGAMIALAGALRLAAGERSGLEVTIRPRWPLEELDAVPDPAAATER